MKFYSDENANVPCSSIQYEFITNNLQLLAAIGWQGHLSQGKGLLLLYPFDENIKSDWLIPYAFTDFAGIYIGEQGQAFQDLFRSNWEKLASVVAESVADRVSLVAFHDRETNTFSIFFVGEPSVNPVQSYQLLQPRLVEFMLGRSKN